MTRNFYNKLNNIFIFLSIILTVLALIYNNLFDIVTAIIFLLGGISAIINGKFKLNKYNKISFKEQFYLGIFFLLFSIFLIIIYTIRLI